MWQKDDSCCYAWQDARDYCKTLELGGFDDWHLPTISELRSLIRGCEATETDGACGIDDNCLSVYCWTKECEGCSYLEGPANGYYWPIELEGDGVAYWSMSILIDAKMAAFAVNYRGSVFQQNFTQEYSVRCVR